jgi:hypothetical protein
MHDICGKQPLLGTLLVEHGAVRLDDVLRALNLQIETGKRLGDTLIELGLVSRPALARALATQSGVELDEECGFGAGLRTRIEYWHLARRGLDTLPAATLEPEAIDHAAPRGSSGPPMRKWAKAYLY